MTQTIRRMGVGTIGPVLVAGVHFALSLLIWLATDTAHFGAFSFLIVLVQFSFAMLNALAGTPLSVPPRGLGADGVLRYRAACLQAGALYMVAAAAAIGLICFVSALPAHWALCLLFTGTANLRWLARSFAFALERPAVAASSDIIYVLGVGAGALLLAATDSVSLEHVLAGMTAANILSLLICDRGFLKAQAASLSMNGLKNYVPIWNQSKWLLSGVATTEASSNAHVYFITAAGGPTAYAPIAFATLFFRPASVFLMALVQLERPALARLTEAGEFTAARRATMRSMAATLAIWLLNVALAGAVLATVGDVIQSRGYDYDIVLPAVVIWAAIMMVRSVRTPHGTLLEARMEYRSTAGISAIVALFTVALVGALAFFGALFALVGILAGEMALAVLFARRVRQTDHD